MERVSRKDEYIVVDASFRYSPDAQALKQFQKVATIAGLTSVSDAFGLHLVIPRKFTYIVEVEEC